MSNENVYGMEPSRPGDYHALRLQMIRERWDQKADRWDLDLADEHFHLNEDGAYRRFLEIAGGIIADRAEFCRQRALVDLGCGTGLVLAHFLGFFAAGVGIDISPRMLAVAARRRLPCAIRRRKLLFSGKAHCGGGRRVFARHPAFALWPALGSAAVPAGSPFAATRRRLCDSGFSQCRGARRLRFQSE